jgi:N-methylhydantoinase B
MVGEKIALDPITREIVQNALACAADEMALALYRTAYSTIVRDCLDYSTSLCDEQGRMIAQGVTIPLHLGSVPTAMDALFRRFGDEIEPDDIFIMNDPFDGGMHIPDIFIIKPIFYEGHRVGFAVSTAHHSDLGGRVPGSSACDNTEIFQDGFRIPWLKLYRRGVPDSSIFALLQANVRVPRVTLGDIRAQISACNIGENAIVDLIRRYGLEIFRACADDVIDYTERKMRAEIASWPEGSYSFTDYMDSDGVGGPPVCIHVTLTVSGGQGERIYHRQPGGGGFGDPLCRDPERVAQDVRNESVSPGAAREHYGVVLDSVTGEVDYAATAALRARRQGGEA